MTMNVKNRGLPSESLPMNRRVYDAVTGCVASVLRALMFLLSALRGPALVAAVLTLFVSFADGNPVRYVSTNAGAHELAGMFILYLVAFSGIFLAVKVVAVVARALFK